MLYMYSGEYNVFDVTLSVYLLSTLGRIYTQEYYQKHYEGCWFVLVTVCEKRVTICNAAGFLLLNL